jgi:uncharacterized membrane protein YdjX (TVP38/TMEM64 family)
MRGNIFVSDNPYQAPGRIAARFLQSTVVVAIAAGLCALAWWLKRSELLVGVIDWIRGVGAWAPLAFITLYVLAAVAGVPASVLTLGAGILFGFLQGVVCVFTAAMTAAIFSFLVSRHFAREWVVKRFGARTRFRSLDLAVAHDGWKIVLLMRLAPAIPFAVTNYLFGLTRVPLWQYIVASFGMLPATMFYVYLGTLAGDFSGLKTQSIPMWARITIVAVGALALIYITRFASRALRQRQEIETGTPARN